MEEREQEDMARARLVDEHDSYDSDTRALMEGEAQAQAQVRAAWDAADGDSEEGWDGDEREGEGEGEEKVVELDSDEGARVAIRGRSSLVLWLGCFPLAVFGINWRISEILIALAIAVGNILIFFLEWKGGSLKSAGKAVGVVMQAMFVPILLPVTRRSALLWITRCSFERAIFFHKWCGRWMVVLGVVHTIIMLVVYTQKGGFHTLYKELTKFNIVTGELAFACMLGLTLFSIKPVRRRFYEIFMKSHYILFLAATGLSLLHKKRLQGLAIVAIPLVLYVVDKALQLVYFGAGRTKLIRAHAVGEEYVRLEFDWVGSYQPLQWLYILMPAVSRVQAHPFSFASCPTRKDRVGVLVKVDGDWTRRLLRLLQEAPEKLQKVYVDGPHGTLTIRAPNFYSCLLLVAGGGGGPPLLALLKSTMLNNQSELEERRTHVTLVWVCRSPLLFMEYAEELAYLEERFGTGLMQVVLHVTQPGADVLDHPLDFRSHDLTRRLEGELMQDLQEPPADLRRFLHDKIRQGRPDMREHMVEAAARSLEAGGNRVGVVTCTPGKFTRAVVKAVSQVNRFCSSPVRFDVHREVYSI
mmetsp:Transcript_10765/g.44132  ORF Transcript_10765/g.44132 Transcript_10765/m.44132 type:complete len:583 (-) Transcript_10765:22-1770(-)